MNLPNKLTTLRVIMIPFFVVFMLADMGRTGDYIALALFCLASLTDFFDGYLAKGFPRRPERRCRPSPEMPGRQSQP